MTAMPKSIEGGVVPCPPYGLDAHPVTARYVVTWVDGLGYRHLRALPTWASRPEPTHVLARWLDRLLERDMTTNPPT